MVRGEGREGREGREGTLEKGLLYALFSIAPFSSSSDGVSAFLTRDPN